MLDPNNGEFDFRVSNSQEFIIWVEFNSLTFNGISMKGNYYINYSPSTNTFKLDTCYGKCHRMEGFWVDAPPGATKKAREAILLACKAWLEANPGVFEDAAVKDCRYVVKNNEEEISNLLNKLALLRNQVNDIKAKYPNVDFETE